MGDCALTVELGEGIDLATNARVRALDAALAAHPFSGFVEAVPTYRALLVVYDPTRLPYDDARAAVLETIARGLPEVPDQGAPRVIPAIYGGEHGPDLEEVARARGLAADEVVRLHASAEYRAFMVGFMPGFAYLGPLPESLATPRRATPRPRVPAGSVGIAGRQTGVYPVSSPGGWNLIARTSVRFFDPAAEPPALVLPGDRVRFAPVAELPAPDPPPAAARPSGPAAVEVLDGGLLTTIQDAGRLGYRRLGVGTAGPMDARAHADANGALGNPPGEAALECVVAGPALRFLVPLRFAIAGADLGAVLHRSDLGAWPVPAGGPVLARPGNVLAFTGRRAGCRAYVALAGGIEAPVVLGSRATDVVAGLGGLEGRPLRAGDRLATRGAAAAAGAPHPGFPARDEVTVRVVMGPQEDRLHADARARFLAETWDVLATSDRVGCRLSGPPLEHAGEAEIVSDGMVPGCIQVPPDGQPIVMMADAPTTGGYPKVATVVRADLPLLAQLVPGHGRVRFRAVTVADAQRARGA